MNRNDKLTIRSISASHSSYYHACTFLCKCCERPASLNRTNKQDYTITIVRMKEAKNRRFYIDHLHNIPYNPPS